MGCGRLKVVNVSLLVSVLTCRVVLATWFVFVQHSASSRKQPFTE